MSYINFTAKIETSDIDSAILNPSKSLGHAHGPYRTSEQCRTHDDEYSRRLY